jgi:hypothetical protein
VPLHRYEHSSIHASRVGANLSLEEHGFPARSSCLGASQGRGDALRNCRDVLSEFTHDTVRDDTRIPRATVQVEGDQLLLTRRQARWQITESLADGKSKVPSRLSHEEHRVV